jgi:hypothetical protein
VYCSRSLLENLLCHFLQRIFLLLKRWRWMGKQISDRRNKHSSRAQLFDSFGGKFP